MITGAIIGALGSVGNRILGIWESERQAKRDQRRRSDEYELAKLNGIKDTMVASFQHDSALQEGISQWVADIRALVRPALTFLALGIVTVIYFAEDTDSGGRAAILASVVEFSAMAGTWWFADRFRK